LKENIVYLTSNDPRNKSSKRLDAYYPDRSNTFAEEDAQEAELAPVILLIASPSYRFLSSKSFPSSQIALRLRRLGYCVVVPSLTSFPEGTAKEMVYEIRESLRWIKEEIRAFGGDKERVWILGQGVGATLTALSVIQSAVVVSRDEEMEKRAQREERRRQRESRVDRDSRNGRDSDGEEEG
jgi:acetyl esterase/lipase